ncbi:molybdopterin-dependent oxidoreductase [Candidatus Woesearchaeota archaeon]|nr:molybdopterin-dependent oxidoreductase [Candidatus Woesearchaeota archaeon]
MADADHVIQGKKHLLDIFRKQGRHEQTDARLPPGQKLVSGFPVLDLGVQPDMDLKDWKLEVSGEVEKPGKYSLAELKKLGIQQYSKDFHCVTSWTKYDVKWTGIPFRKILAMVKPTAKWKHLIQHGAEGYSTNVPREDVERDDVFLAFELDGMPIPREHGHIRLIIPQLYAWKASKFLVKLEFAAMDQPGFWERRGYHNHGDAAKEERYS